MTDTLEKIPDQRPPHLFLDGRHFGDESDDRSSSSVTFSRLCHTDDGWRTSSYGLNGLLHLAIPASRAHQAVEELTLATSAT